MLESNRFSYLAGNKTGGIRRPEDKSLQARLKEIYKDNIPNTRELRMREIREIFQKINTKL